MSIPFCAACNTFTAMQHILIGISLLISFGGSNSKLFRNIPIFPRHAHTSTAHQYPSRYCSQRSFRPPRKRSSEACDQWPASNEKGNYHEGNASERYVATRPRGELEHQTAYFPEEAGGATHPVTVSKPEGEPFASDAEFTEEARQAENVCVEDSELCPSDEHETDWTVFSRSREKGRHRERKRRAIERKKAQRRLVRDEEEEFQKALAQM